jgi:Tfp pilus assembly protein PilF
LTTLYGDNARVAGLEAATSGIVYMALGQVQNALSATDTVLESDVHPQIIVDSYAVRGVLLCSQDKLTEAETAYSQALERDPTFYMAQLLRAEVREAQGDTFGALADLAMIRASDWAQRAEIQDLIAAAVAHEISCKTMFENSG